MIGFLDLNAVQNHINGYAAYQQPQYVAQQAPQYCNTPTLPPLPTQPTHPLNFSQIPEIPQPMPYCPPYQQYPQYQQQAQNEEPNLIDAVGDLTLGTLNRVGKTATGLVNGILDIVTFGYGTK